MSQERLQKILARAGVASRRAAEQLITSGRVRVNGAVVSELGARADTDTDRIDVDGTPIAREQHVYYLIHKPRGMVTTLKDPEDRPSLSELLHDIPERIYPVGRLDFHTSGALLLTNDGDLAQALLHPSRAVPKTYVVKVSVEVGETMLGQLERGVMLDDGYRTQQAFVEHIRDEDGKSWIQITITEGKNRQIHRMIEALGARVMRLSRISFAGLTTEELRPGEIRPLYQDEIAALKRDYMGDTGARVKPERQRRESVRSAADASARERHDSERPARGRSAPSGARAEKRRESDKPARAQGSGEGPARRPVRDRLPREYLVGKREEPSRDRSGRDKAAGARDKAAGAREKPRGARAEEPRPAASAKRPTPREGAREGVRAAGGKAANTKPSGKTDMRPRPNSSTQKSSPRNAGTRAEKSSTSVDSPRGARHKSRPT